MAALLALILGVVVCVEIVFIYCVAAAWDRDHE